jgi:hypothetical protein
MVRLQAINEQRAAGVQTEQGPEPTSKLSEAEARTKSRKTSHDQEQPSLQSTSRRRLQVRFVGVACVFGSLLSPSKGYVVLGACY